MKKLCVLRISSIFLVMLTVGMGIAIAANRQVSNPIGYGFHAQMTAKPGMGDAVVDLLFQAPAFVQEDCLIFLIGRSQSNPDLIFVTEGWTSQEAHASFTNTDAAKVYIEKFTSLVQESSFVDEIPIGGKAVLE